MNSSNTEKGLRRLIKINLDLLKEETELLKEQNEKLATLAKNLNQENTSEN